MPSNRHLVDAPLFIKRSSKLPDVGKSPQSHLAHVVVRAGGIVRVLDAVGDLWFSLAGPGLCPCTMALLGRVEAPVSPWQCKSGADPQCAAAAGGGVDGLGQWVASPRL